MTESGQLRHWLRFERYVADQDSDGALVESWEDAFDANPRMPCRLETLSGRELLAAQTVNSRVTHRISVRYRPDFSAALRAVSDGGTIYNIEAVLPDERNRFATLMASSGLNAGGTAA